MVGFFSFYFMLIHWQHYKEFNNKSHMLKFQLNTGSTCWENSKNLQVFSQECFIHPHLARWQRVPTSSRFVFGPQSSNLSSKHILCHRLSMNNLVFFRFVCWFYCDLNTHQGGYVRITSLYYYYLWPQHSISALVNLRSDLYMNSFPNVLGWQMSTGNPISKQFILWTVYTIIGVLWPSG